MRAFRPLATAFAVVLLLVPWSATADPAPSPDSILATAMGIAEQIRSELENLTHYPDLFNELANATNSPQNGTYAATVARICMLTVQGPCSLCNVISSHWVGGVIENPYAKPFVGSTVSVDFAYPGISDSTAILPRQPYIGTWYGTFTYGPGIVLQC